VHGVRDRLPEPLVVRPVTAGRGVGVVLGQRYAAGAPEVLPGAEQPPEVGLDEGGRRESGRGDLDCPGREDVERHPAIRAHARRPRPPGA
jgi:hypothetical protein